MHRTPIFLLVASLGFLPMPGASAVDNEWAVIPATMGETTPVVARAVSAVRRELEHQGRRVWPSEAAGARFEHRGSSESAELPEEEIRRWSRHSLSGIRALAKGEHRAALRHLAQAEQMSRQATAELNRDSSRAQQMLDTCLYMVRALLETNDTAGAELHSTECALLVPYAEPAPLMHPPHVLAVYQAARSRGPDAGGNLLVESTPSGCNTRINGVLTGRTPLEATGLVAGDYGVQVECEGEQRGRVHPVIVGSATTKIRIDTQFDRSVRTKPILRLEYSKPPRHSWRAIDARAIAEMLPAQMVVVLSAPTPDSIAVGLVTRTGSRHGCGHITATADGLNSEELARAIHRLVDGQCGDLSASRADRSSLSKPGI